MMGRGRDKTYSRSGMSGLCHPRIDLSPGQLAALARLCTLCHFYLYLLCAYQVAAGNPETAGCHLLDGGTAVVPCRSGNQAVQALAALPSVGFAVNTVHRYGQAFMSLLGDGAIGHSPCLKPPDNGFHGLYLVQGDASVLWKVKIHQGTQMVHLIFSVHLGRILFKNIIITCPGRLLKEVDGQRIIKVILLTGAGLVTAHAFQGQIHIQPQGIKGSGVKGIHIPCNILQCNTAHTAHRIRKIFIHHIL